MKLIAIIKADAEFVRSSGFKVECDSKHDWVSIDNGDRNIFLQGHEAVCFIDEVSALWDKTQTLDQDVIALHLAKPYIEALS